MSLADVLFGRPLASSEEHNQRIGPAQGIPIFGLDALSSAAYGPEAALTILLPPGTGGAGLDRAAEHRDHHPARDRLLQSSPDHRRGGGSYTVAKENLGARAGLLAAAALMIDR